MKYNLTQEQKQHYLERGYIIIEDFLPIDIVNQLLDYHKQIKFWAFGSNNFSWNNVEWKKKGNRGQINWTDISTETLYLIREQKQWLKDNRYDYDVDKNGIPNNDNQTMSHNAWNYGIPPDDYYEDELHNTINYFVTRDVMKHMIPIHYELKELLGDFREPNFQISLDMYDWWGYIGWHQDNVLEQDYPHETPNLNSSIHLNKDWKSDWGGQLMLIDSKGDKVTFETGFNKYIAYNQVKGIGLRHCTIPIKTRNRLRRNLTIRDFKNDAGSWGFFHYDKQGNINV